MRNEKAGSGLGRLFCDRYWDAVHHLIGGEHEQGFVVAGDNVGEANRRCKAEALRFPAAVLIDQK